MCIMSLRWSLNSDVLQDTVHFRNRPFFRTRWFMFIKNFIRYILIILPSPVSLRSSLWPYPTNCMFFFPQKQNKTKTSKSFKKEAKVKQNSLQNKKHTPTELTNTKMKITETENKQKTNKSNSNNSNNNDNNNKIMQQSSANPTELILCWISTPRHGVNQPLSVGDAFIWRKLIFPLPAVNCR